MDHTQESAARKTSEEEMDAAAAIASSSMSSSSSSSVRALPPHQQMLLHQHLLSLGCEHYRRKCKFYTPCCQKTYRCRFCHDLVEGHVLQREDVREVECSVCFHRQGVKGECENCGTVFGKYFCFECKLFDDDASKQQFHCHGCGICRIGGRNNFFHCEKCDMCLPTHLHGRHKCIENLSKANCPICQEDIHTSREPSQIPPCNHLIHKSCFEQLIASGHYYCPICYQSLVDMTEMWKFLDQQIRETPLPSSYHELYCQVYCRDCLTKSQTKFHFVGLKCPRCSGYNTTRSKGPLLRKKKDSNEYVEVNFHDSEPTDLLDVETDTAP